MAKFQLGTVLSTPGITELVSDEDGTITGSEGVTLPTLIRRHLSGDWGDLDEEDRVANEKALTRNLRLMSVYQLTPTLSIWIITEADRSVTTVLLPSEY